MSADCTILSGYTASSTLAYIMHLLPSSSNILSTPIEAIVPAPREGWTYILGLYGLDVAALFFIRQFTSRSILKVWKARPILIFPFWPGFLDWWKMPAREVLVPYSVGWLSNASLSKNANRAVKMILDRNYIE